MAKIAIVLGIILNTQVPDLQGVATYYSKAKFGGQPLRCDYQFAEKLIYSETTQPWFAVDINEYTSGNVQCGDEFLLDFGDGRWLIAQALDSGTFRGYWVSTWPDKPIVVDLPEHLKPFDGMSGLVKAYNLSKVERENGN
jgi:hypothetical protein